VSDDMQIYVQSTPAANPPVWTNSVAIPAAQPDTTIGEALGEVTYTAYCMPQDPAFIQMLTTQIGSTPSVATIEYLVGGGWTGPTDPAFVTVKYSDLVPGTYTFRWSAENGTGNFSYDTIQVIVVAESKDPPIANAGADQVIYINGNGTTTVTSSQLFGVATEGDTTIASRNWNLLNGDPSAIIDRPTSDTTNISLLVRGTYSFLYMVTDRNNLYDLDTVVVDVRSVSAGNDTAFSAPGNSAPLNGTMYGGGTIFSYEWSIVSGTGGSISSSGNINASAENLGVGTYVFQLAVTYDGGQTVYDTKTIEVIAAESTTTRKIKRP
jgi:hypothetical protein